MEVGAGLVHRAGPGEAVERASEHVDAFGPRLVDVVAGPLGSCREADQGGPVSGGLGPGPEQLVGDDAVADIDGLDRIRMDGDEGVEGHAASVRRP
jgi:hypothetical protein